MTFWNILRRRSAILSSLTASAIISAHTVSEACGIYMFKRHLELYDEENVVALPQGTLHICQEVLDDILLSAEHESLITFYQTKLPWIVSRGSVKNRFGAFIGLPTTYNHDEYRDGVPNGIHTSDCKSDNLFDRNDIIFSEKAKKFSIARDIYASTTQHLWVCNCIGVVLFWGGYSMGHFVRRYGHIKYWARLLTYNTIGIISVYAFFVFYGHYYKYRHIWADKMATRLGRDYSLGAIEYYEKLSYKQANKVPNQSLFQKYMETPEFLYDLPANVRLNNVKVELDFYT